MFSKVSQRNYEIASSKLELNEYGENGENDDDSRPTRRFNRRIEETQENERKTVASRMKRYVARQIKSQESNYREVQKYKWRDKGKKKNRIFDRESSESDCEPPPETRSRVKRKAQESECLELLHVFIPPTSSPEAPNDKASDNQAKSKNETGRRVYISSSDSEEELAYPHPRQEVDQESVQVENATMTSPGLPEISSTTRIEKKESIGDYWRRVKKERKDEERKEKEAAMPIPISKSFLRSPNCAGPPFCSCCVNSGERRSRSRQPPRRLQTGNLSRVTIDSSDSDSDVSSSCERRRSHVETQKLPNLDFGLRNQRAILESTSEEEEKEELAEKSVPPEKKQTKKGTRTTKAPPQTETKQKKPRARKNPVPEASNAEPERKRRSRRNRQPRIELTDPGFDPREISLFGVENVPLQHLNNEKKKKKKPVTTNLEVINPNPVSSTIQVQVAEESELPLLEGLEEMEEFREYDDLGSIKGLEGTIPFNDTIFWNHQLVEDTMDSGFDQYFTNNNTFKESEPQFYDMSYTVLTEDEAGMVDMEKNEVDEFRIDDFKSVNYDFANLDVLTEDETEVGDGGEEGDGMNENDEFRVEDFKIGAYELDNLNTEVDPDFLNYFIDEDAIPPELLRTIV